MRDLYQQLGIADDADKTDIEQALASADPPTRAAASAILLNDHRRPAYDRNRKLMLTIGRLRFSLGLNLTPFWARDEHADFTVGEPKESKAAAIDSMIVTRAFTPSKRRRRRYMNARIKEVLLATAGGVLSLILLALLIYAIQQA